MTPAEGLPLLSANGAITIHRMSLVPSANSIFEALVGETIAERPSVEPVALADEVESFFDALHDPLKRYLGSFRLGVQDAEDITQEVFIALFKHLRAGGPRTNLKAWIFRVAHNLGLKRQQRNRRASQLTSPAEQVLEVQIDPCSNPEEQLMEDQCRKRLLAVFNAFPDRDRHCLSLRAEGLRYREIAHVLGVSLGTVAASLERSLGRLGAVERSAV
jgi:RNA polymerase sigma-70 factor (ECF subfamily)